MAETPLVPHQVVLVALGRLPLLKTNVEDLPDPRLLGELFCKLGYGLDDIDLLGDAEQETFCDTAYAIFERRDGTGQLRPSPTTLQLRGARALSHGEYNSPSTTFQSRVDSPQAHLRADSEFG